MGNIRSTPPLFTDDDSLKWFAALEPLSQHSVERAVGGDDTLGIYVQKHSKDVMTRIPESLFPRLTVLTKLVLGDCRALKSLPDSLGELQALTTLELWSCESLTALPASLGKLQALTKLGLSHCKSLTALPDSLGQLGALITLDLNGCGDSYLGKSSGLQALPLSVGQLQKLTDLDLSFCSNLKALPESLGKLRALKKLNLRCCPITMLPKSFGQLHALTELILSRRTHIMYVLSDHSTERAERILKRNHELQSAPRRLEALRKELQSAPGRLEALHMHRWLEEGSKDEDASGRIPSMFERREALSIERQMEEVINDEDIMNAEEEQIDACIGVWIDYKNQHKRLAVDRLPSKNAKTLLRAALGWERFYAGRFFVCALWLALYMGVAELMTRNFGLYRFESYVLGLLVTMILIAVWFQLLGCCSTFTRVWWSFFPEAFGRLGFGPGPVPFSVVVPKNSSGDKKDGPKPQIVLNTAPQTGCLEAFVETWVACKEPVKWCLCGEPSTRCFAYLLEDVESVAVYEINDDVLWKASAKCNLWYEKDINGCPQSAFADPQYYYYRNTQGRAIERASPDNQEEKSPGIGPACVCLDVTRAEENRRGCAPCHKHGAELNSGRSSERWWRLGIVLSRASQLGMGEKYPLWLSRKTCRPQEISELFVLRDKMEKLIRTHCRDPEAPPSKEEEPGPAAEGGGEENFGPVDLIF